MLSALYTYKGSQSNARVINFEVNDKFLEVGVSKDGNWVHVIDQNGKIGYIPKNYVANEQPSPEQMLVMIDQFMEIIRKEAMENEGYLTRNHYEANNRLTELKKTWAGKQPPPNHQKKKQAPLPPTPPGESSIAADKSKEDQEPVPESSTSFIGRGSSVGPEANPSNQTNGYSESSSTPHFEESNKSLVDISELQKRIAPGFARKVAEKVRAHTNVSFGAGLEALEIVVKSFGELLPELKPIFSSLLSAGDCKQTVPWMESVDGRNLMDILEQLRECKDDQQQRSWALHEDKDIITNLLRRLLEILNEGDQEICRPVMEMDDCRPILTLVQYYQMETRWELRNILLQIFGVICEASKTNISFLSASILPLELTREILDEETPKEQIGYIVLVLRMILSMSDTLPSTHFTIMNDSFVRYVLHSIETYSKDSETDLLADNFLDLLLAFNLQFAETFFDDGRTNQQTKHDNIVIQSIRQDEQFQANFFEKLLLLFNREDDPVAMFDFEPRPAHAVLRMMQDVYLCPQTAKLIYTNDEKVVCDIILRRVTDLPVEDKRRNQYWTIFQGILHNGQWNEHQHRKLEFEKIASPEILKEILQNS